MNKILPSLFLAAALTIPAMAADEKSIHEFTVESIDGKKVDLSDYKGKVVLIVNVASKCGYTKHYKNMVSLHEKMKEEGVVVVGVPANNFGGQEPGSNEEIEEFCSAKFGVEFPMMAKVSVKGDDKSELFEYLTAAENEDFTGDIKWNFEKFVIGKDGKLKRRFRSSAEPDGEEVVAAIKTELKAK